MTGKELKGILRKHDISGRQLAADLGLTENAVYVWFSAKSVKSKVLKRIAAKYPLPELDVPRSFVSEVNEEPATYIVARHIGKLVSQVRENKGISITSFARLMNESRQTSINYFAKKDWPEERMIHASKVMNVTLAELKGNTEVKSFEQEIYFELKFIKDMLRQVHEAVTTKHAYTA